MRGVRAAGGLAVVVVFCLAPLHARSEGRKPAPVPRLNQKIVKYCADNLGKKVDNGECAQLAAVALWVSGARPMINPVSPKPPMKRHDYVWGRLVNPEKETVHPGDVIQMRDLEIRVVNPDGSGWRWVYPHHTAVVEEVPAKNRYRVLHQNFGDNTKTEAQKRVVQRAEIDLNHKAGGHVWIYRPLPRRR